MWQSSNVSADVAEHERGQRVGKAIAEGVSERDRPRQFQHPFRTAEPVPKQGKFRQCCSSVSALSVVLIEACSLRRGGESWGVLQMLIPLGQS